MIMSYQSNDFFFIAEMAGFKIVPDVCEEGRPTRLPHGAWTLFLLYPFLLKVISAQRLFVDTLSKRGSEST